MKKNVFLTTFFALLFFVHLSIAAGAEVTIYGDRSYPPYSYLDKAGKPSGIYVDIMQAAFAKIDGVELRVKMAPWKRIIDLVKSGKALAFFPPYFTQERTAWLTFSEPILPETTVLFGKPESFEGKSKWPEDFYGSTIGLNSGFNPVSMGTQAFQDAIDAGKITLDDKGVKNEANLKKLAAGRIDFYLNDQMIDISAFPGITRRISVNKNHGYLGFTKVVENYPSLSVVQEKFNAVIKEMKATGEIDAILNSYIK